jgi:hypothetical protein
VKEFNPSKDFVCRVMRSVYAYENEKACNRLPYEKLLASRPFRYAMSGGGVFIGIFMIPAACI